MTSKTLGKDISKVEVTNISKHGFWLYVKDKEYFLSYHEYPWFKNAKVGELLEVRLLHRVHLYWPQLDVDLELSTLQDPKGYPLVYNLQIKDLK